MEKAAILLAVILAAALYIAWPDTEPAHPSDPKAEGVPTELVEAKPIEDQVTLPTTREAVTKESADPAFPPDYTGPGDERVLEIYLSNARIIENTPKTAKEQGRELSEIERDRLAWTKAVNQMIQEQRFYYLGPQETRRAHRNTGRLRYISTYRDGLLMIWELSKAEFPDAFESWPR